MRTVTFLILSILMTCAGEARVLRIGSGGYADLQAAAADALPGDTILFLSGTHQGGAYVENLQGRADAWIIIMGEADALISGGTNAFQLTDPAYLHIRHLTFDDQTGNGVNIDDGGSYDTPAHHLLIEDCTWRGIDATGNNDMLKLSGVDSFAVRGCRFIDGSPGGSMVDMVGCHDGIFEGNHFENAGSNCIQAKGGTRYIRIERNAFQNGGERSINIGGSTGLPYFRPVNANYEASDILVAANVFTGSVAPIAYVGAVNCAVVQNTIYLPEKWAVRILQESTDARFLPCGNNTFLNNIVMVDNRAAGPTFNIGPNTAPETFLFRNNLWFNIESAAWGGPNLPVMEVGGIIGSDPRLRAPALTGGDFSLLENSPAIGAGTPVAAPLKDFTGKQFNVPPSIGAFEYQSGTGVAEDPAAAGFSLEVYPNPARSAVTLRVLSRQAAGATLRIFDAAAREILRRDCRLEAGLNIVEWNGRNGSGEKVRGVFFLQITTASGWRGTRVILGQAR